LEVVMKTFIAAVSAFAVGSALMAIGGVLNFDDLKPGAPAGWTATQTGSGKAQWVIEKDDTAPSKPNVLKQTGNATFPVCLKEGVNLQDGFVEVKFKPISGSEDQAAGLIWRAKDADNYYVARANALENNVTIYHTINGRRTEKKRARMTVANGQWQSLRVDFTSSHFAVMLNGKPALEWDDTTFKDAGRVGVWTKADSVTAFDDFQYGDK
jgi:3-keto-disaccharide hydrolase